MSTCKTIIFDTETTGIDNAQVLQLSIIDANKNILFNEYFKPRNVQSWERAEQIHHITYDMVKNKHTFKYYQKQVQQIFDDATTIIGYNVKFDLKMIANYIHIDYMEKTIIDVMPMFAEIYNDIHPYYNTPRWQKLTTATMYYKYDWNEYGQPHGALADSYATLYVYNHIKEKEQNENGIHGNDKTSL